MMDQIASLLQRGLISPDVAQGLVQQVANVTKPGVPNPLLEGGGAGTRIGATTTREPILGTAQQGHRGWLGDLMSKPKQDVPQDKPKMSLADQKTARYRIMERARNPERGNAGQLEEQYQRIMDDTERLFQEAANQHGRPLRLSGKMYYPEK